jgi:hypothetical protein
VILRRLSALVAAVAAPAFAAHPLQTEDTGTQGTGNVEIENGLQRAHAGGASAFTYQPQVSVGLATTVDAIVQPSWVSQHDPAAGTRSGPGDTNLDAKWRFWGADPWSLGVRAGIEAPTAQRGLGLPRGRIAEHALAVVTWDASPTTVHANLGFTHAPAAAGARATLAHASAALMQTLNERLILTVDGELDQDPGRRSHAWPGAMLAGAIWTARPGLDLDVGYQVGTHATPAVREWLAGITYRFAL